MKLIAAVAAASLFLFAADSKAPGTAPELFDSAKVWSIHLTFSADQWQAMEPKGGPPAGGPGGRGGFGGPPGMGGRGGPGGFDFANVIASSFVRAMDEGKDGVISRDEFLRAFAKWFEAWGGDKGPLTEEQVRAGINRDLVPR